MFIFKTVTDAVLITDIIRSNDVWVVIAVGKNGTDPKRMPIMQNDRFSILQGLLHAHEWKGAQGGMILYLLHTADLPYNQSGLRLQTLDLLKSISDLMGSRLGLVSCGLEP